MKPAPETAPQQASLWTFLSSEVLEEPNGMRVTVMSLLSRIGRDPWREAERLARLPRPNAANDLAWSIFSACPSCRTLSMAEIIAASLVSDLTRTSPAVKPPLSLARSRNGLMTRLALMLAIVWALLYFSNAHPGADAARTTTAATASPLVQVR